MAITKSDKVIKFVKGLKTNYQDINNQYQHCIFFATDDKVIMVDGVEYGLGSAGLTEVLKKLVTDIKISGNNTITLVDAEAKKVGNPITINNASATVAGLMSADDKKKFDSFFGSGAGEGVNLDAIWNTIGEKGSGSEVQATTLWGGINEVQNGLKTFKAQKGQNNGLAPLDETGVIPSKHLPSYVDDVVEVSTEAGLPQPGESGKIYVTANTNLIYRWVVPNTETETGKYIQIPITSAESITRLNTIQTKNGEVDSNYSIERGVQEAKTYTDDSLSWYEDNTQG